ncbi:uncharacterized protein Dana_GF21376, isoform B [Drosophila ananassae]|uniref:Uncharacterized protein, isoform A n=1 Tax=Drosophila ananassae TaxID=7217 RepID=B3MU06_DROAN|nr:early boundary activity protein 3 [Drosophila ananassae]EDV33335.1 uncharacterized protein Dana_GF21376, isoform A [Drosophila ananassae]KPU74393.1 uncharacterized protein Dana_GF21376, isoform B [Drosophila ananassae]
MSNISNDSGLDDSANCGAVANSHPLAATRLSWFLAEVDDGAMSNGKPNGHPRLCVLHSMELLETDVSEKYMTRFVEFRVNGMVLEAKLILAADERRLVDAALLSMSKEQREDSNSKQLLVQYTENEEAGERLVHKLASPNNVRWLSAKPELANTPLVSLSPGCVAHVLYAYDNRDYMEKLLLHMKTRCFDDAFDENLDAEATMTDDTWMLVQYSPDPETVVYQVVQYSQTVWRQENLFKDVIAYIQQPGNDLVLQAVVISYGLEKEVQQAKFEHLRNLGMEMQFPLPGELSKQLEQGSGTAALFSRTSLYQKAEQRDATGEHKELRRSLEQMSEKAQVEAQMIIDAFDMVDNINKNLQYRLSGDGPLAETTSADELQ